MLDIVMLHYCGTRLCSFPLKSIVFYLPLWFSIWLPDIQQVLFLLAVWNCNSFQYCMILGISIQLSFLIIVLTVASQRLTLRMPAQCLAEDSKGPPYRFLCVFSSQVPPLCYSTSQIPSTVAALNSSPHFIHLKCPYFSNNLWCYQEESWDGCGTSHASLFLKVTSYFFHSVIVV